MNASKAQKLNPFRIDTHQLGSEDVHSNVNSSTIEAPSVAKFKISTKRSVTPLDHVTTKKNES